MQRIMWRLTLAALVLSVVVVPQSQPLTYFCPMHMDVTAKAAGKCGKCGMALVPGDPWDEREYVLDVQTTPSAPRAGEPTGFRLLVADPTTRQPVADYVPVHDKRFHLFVVSQDLEHFAHIHPEQQPDGSWAIDHTLSKPGYYRVYSDFLPMGGTPQVIARTVATQGYKGDLARSIATLVPDRAFIKTVDGTTLRLTFEPSPIAAGVTTKLKYEVSADGRPVTDLEPYLAAWGHTLVLSEDALEYIHAHPIEYLPPDAAEAKGGPTITFDALFPKPGRYRLWTQFKRHGIVSTATFTVEAMPATSLP